MAELTDDVSTKPELFETAFGAYISGTDNMPELMS